MSIEVINIHKTFGSFAALREVNLRVGDGELVALLGPSGSGKTTLLRIIAGLEAPDRTPGAAVRFHGEDVSRRPVRARRVGFVFQHYALFRHMSVYENVAFGLRVKPRRERPSRAEIGERVHSLLRLVQLEGFSQRYPNELSGGQRQRVALARALAVEPRVLLLDEPFGALDAKVRMELRRWLRRLHDELHITSVFVTHDQDEALEVADRVVVMNHGRVIQEGHPEEVFHAPADEFVMRFLGSVNVFHGRIEGGRVRLGPLEFDAPNEASSRDGAARGFVRPHELEVHAAANGMPSFRARVEHVNAAGPRAKVSLVTDEGLSVQAEVSLERYRKLKLAAGQTVWVGVRDLRLAVEAEQKALDERLYNLTGIQSLKS